MNRVARWVLLLAMMFSVAALLERTVRPHRDLLAVSPAVSVAPPTVTAPSNAPVSAAADLMDASQFRGPIHVPPVPADWASEQVGSVRVRFPSALRPQLRDAMEHLASDLRNIALPLGLHAIPPLELRFVPDPETMRTYAPVEMPPPAYAVGVAYPPLGLTLVSMRAPVTYAGGDVRKTLRHELSHLLLGAATNHVAIPRWFSEGVAIYQAGEHSFERFQTLATASFTNGLLPLSRLDSGFSAGAEQVNVAYAQSADVVGWLMAHGGAGRFGVLLQHLREGMSLDEGCRQTWRKSLRELELDWNDEARARFIGAPLWASTGMLWLVGLLLMVLAYAKRRSKSREILDRWEQEERPVVTAVRPALVVVPGGKSLEEEQNEGEDEHRWN